MSMRLAILCPGQGGQHAAMFALAQADGRGADWLAQSGLAACLPAALDAVLADPVQLYANRNAQPLIVAAQLAAWHALREEITTIAGAPALVAGYSVGEVSAYAIAGVLDPLAAVALAAQRAQWMDEAQRQAASAQQAQGLMSVSGLAIAEVRACLQQTGAFSAIETGEDSLIAGGALPALQAAAEAMAAQGARTGMLPVGLASHTPLMASAQVPFTALLQTLPCADPAVPLLAGVTGQTVLQAHEACALLARQLTHTIQWQACMDACAEQGITVALELGPGAALSRMLRERHPQIASRSLSEFRSLDGALGWLRRQAD